ncbi:putative methyltransferase-like protein 25 [Aplochiton taeniatus]
MAGCLGEIQRNIDKVGRFLSVSLSILNAHTVDFYTRDVWGQFMALPSTDVLSAINSDRIHTGEPEHNAKEKSSTAFGFCNDTQRLVDIGELLEAAKAHSLPGLGVCMTRDELLQSLRQNNTVSSSHEAVAIEPGEFMNSKKSHEVQTMSEVVACLAQHCTVKQVIDVGSGKGYLCSFLSLKYGLQVFGIDSSSTNTHGAQERNRKLKKFSRSYRKRFNAGGTALLALPSGQEDFIDIKFQVKDTEGDHILEGVHNIKSQEINMQLNTGERTSPRKDERGTLLLPEVLSENALEGPGSSEDLHSLDPEREDPFLGALSVDAIEDVSPRVPPAELTMTERERRKRENLERKAGIKANSDSTLFSPLTSYVTAETELRDLINELEDAVMVGLHTCGDLAASTLHMFVAKQELASVCSVGCCYHLLSEEFDPTREESPGSVCGFPMSQYLKDQAWFCGRNARMSACLALERVSVGQGIKMESLFYRAVLHVILRDHYSSFKSEKRVGNVYSKATSFVNYVRRALQRLELDESKLTDTAIQDYLDKYRPRMCEMQAFNMLKVTLAPCIEGLILLDRLCYLKEQKKVLFSALVQLFDPVLSPRCYGIVGVKIPGIA